MTTNKEVKQVILTFGSGDLKYTVEVFFDPPLDYTPKTKLTVESEKPFQVDKTTWVSPIKTYPEEIAKGFVDESLKPSEDLTGRWITRGGDTVLVKQSSIPICNREDSESFWEVALGDFTYYLHKNGNFFKFGENDYDLMKRLPEGFPENPLIAKAK